MDMGFTELHGYDYLNVKLPQLDQKEEVRMLLAFLKRGIANQIRFYYFGHVEQLEFGFDQNEFRANIFKLQETYANSETIVSRILDLVDRMVFDTFESLNFEFYYLLTQVKNFDRFLLLL